MKNNSIAKVFYDVADLLELKGENPFKVRAYQKAARSIELWPRELERMAQDGEDLQQVPGVGEAIAQKISDLLKTGHFELYDELRREFPAGIVELLDIPGVGPKTAMRLAADLGVKSVDELERAIEEGRVAELPHMGEKTAENILVQIQALRRKDQRIPIGEALPLVEELIGHLGALPGVRRVTPAGSLRRFRETVGDIDIMGTAEKPEEVVETFASLPMVRQVLGKGPTKASVILAGGLQVDLRMVERDSFGSLLQFFTGSREHNVQLREVCNRQGLKLSEYGMTGASTGVLEKFATEEEFYRRLGLQYIPPEQREALGEIELARAGKMPRLVEVSDLKGDLHVHSNWSDGRQTIEQMVAAAQAQGYEYLAVTDHSRGLGIASGMNGERLAQQVEEIRALNARLSGFRVFTGIEVDIRSDGTLDLMPEVLETVDIVVASVHSALNQPKDRMTDRVIGAMENPLVDVIAHPTGRMIGGREPVALDMERVFQAALRTGTVLEINAMPQRLDLKDTHAFRARELGVKLVISTDAHRADQLGSARFGIGVARRARCQKEDLLNTMNAQQVEEYLKKHKKHNVV